MLLSYATVNFHLFYDRAVDMQIWTLLIRNQCRVSDTQVTVKAFWMVSSQSFRPVVVVHIDNVIIAEVDTTSSLQKIKIVYGGLFVTKISSIKNV